MSYAIITDERYQDMINDKKKTGIQLDLESACNLWNVGFIYDFFYSSLLAYMCR